jgi:hypothetical protein
MTLKFSMERHNCKQQHDLLFYSRRTNACCISYLLIQAHLCLIYLFIYLFFYIVNLTNKIGGLIVNI